MTNSALPLLLASLLAGCFGGYQSEPGASPESESSVPPAAGAAPESPTSPQAGPAPIAPTPNLHATPATFTQVFVSAQGGDVIALATGNYGQFTGGSHASTVTLVPEPGATPSMTLWFAPADHLTLHGITLRGGYLQGAHDVSFIDTPFTANLRVDATLADARILFDHATFDNITACADCYEGRLTVRGFGVNQPVGVRIINSHFGAGGESDGVQIIGGAYGVEVGPGNEFSGIIQGNYVRHVDPVQLYGSSHTRIVGNYFHGNSTGIMCPDGGNSELIRDNVFVMTNYAAVAAGRMNGLSILHNTIVGNVVRITDSNPGATASHDIVIRDNVLSGGRPAIEVPGSTTSDYNLIAGGGGQGAHDLSGAAQFQSAAPASVTDYALAASSPGFAQASDGLDMGAAL